jgi:hypothetical protein
VTNTSIAILGWGSLLWDWKPEFSEQHGVWALDGPQLKIEFSRVSSTRRGALTLVIDPTNGAVCRVAYAMSRRRDVDDAICDLRCREGTTLANIGFYFADGSRQRSKDQSTLSTVKAWATNRKFDAVIWTDLASNFQQGGRPHFSVENAIAHLKAIDVAARPGAAEYVNSAPDFVVTPVRSALTCEAWFKDWMK